MEGEQNNMGQNLEDNGGTSAGPIIGIIIILAIIILGGLYFWSQRIEDVITTDDTMMTDEILNSINTQNSTDDTSSIETDLNSTDIENLDSELNAS